MKIAYLITSYDQFCHLEKLIDALDDKNVTFYIHVDKKSKMPENFPIRKNVIFIGRIVVWWGGWSQQQSILNLITEAIRHKFDYYVLLSGSDYPIRSRNFLYEKLETGGEYIDIIKGFHDHKPESRTKYYYYDCFDRRNRKSLRTLFFLTLEKVQRIFFTKHNYPFLQIFNGHTWCALSHDCVSYILTFLQNNPQYSKFYKTSFCADECLFPTIIGNSEFVNKCKGTLTYTDWSKGGSGPAIINKEHVSLFKKQLEFSSPYGKYTPVFARKFNDQSDNVIKQIEEELRQ